jgi:hypothetical protein
MSRKYEEWHDQIQLLPVGINPEPHHDGTFSKESWKKKNKEDYLDCYCAKSSASGGIS